MSQGTFVHPQGLCESETVGEGTRIWAFAHVMKGAVVGVSCNVGEGAFVEAGAVLGDRVTLKNQVLVWEGVTIEDDTFIGPGVVFTNDRNPRSPRMSAAASRYATKDGWLARTLVKRGASLGAGAVLLPGLTVGEYAMVGAGALVTRDVAPHRLVLGSPAREAGWVCRCGLRLPDSLACTGCGARYVLAGEGLVPG